jgi:predicted alpha-1,6-mannanase (GH76 family)
MSMKARWDLHIFKLLAGILLLCSTCVSRAGDTAYARGRTWSQRSTLATRGLQAWYNQGSGLYDTTGWWNSANAITTLADYSRITSSREYLSVFSNTFSAAQKTSPNFLNNFYDDEGWWALAWIDVYDLTHRPQYLMMAESIFTDMSGGWDNTCSGGIWWSKDRKYKNAIANELFLSIAAHLGLRAKDAEARRKYLSWAERQWQWFSHSGMIDTDHLVNDGLDESCTNNHKTKWTYNQGVILGGLTALSEANHDPLLMDVADRIAQATISSRSLTDGHMILHEPCEPNCGSDGSQFKGIFVRNLMELNDLHTSPVAKNFVFTNAESVWREVKGPKYQLPLDWAHAGGLPDASTQSSALDVLVAAAEMLK